MTLKIDAKFEGKVTCASIYDMMVLTNFHQVTGKPQSCDFDKTLYLKIIMRNLTNVNLSTQKPQKPPLEWAINFDQSM